MTISLNMKFIFFVSNFSIRRNQIGKNFEAKNFYYRKLGLVSTLKRPFFDFSNSFQKKNNL